MGLKNMKNFSSLILISATLFLASCKSKPTEAQWEGYSKCASRLMNEYGISSSQTSIAIRCKPMFDIPMTKEEKLLKEFLE